MENHTENRMENHKGFPHGLPYGLPHFLPPLSLPQQFSQGDDAATPWKTFSTINSVENQRFPTLLTALKVYHRDSGWCILDRERAEFLFFGLEGRKKPGGLASGLDRAFSSYVRSSRSCFPMSLNFSIEARSDCWRLFSFACLTASRRRVRSPSWAIA